MDKRPVKINNKDIEHAENNKKIEILDPYRQMNPFFSFRYSYREVSSAGGKTHLKAKDKSFIDGKFRSEELEGIAPGNIYNQMVAQMQKMFFGQISSMLNMFSGLLPSVKKDRKD